MPRNECRSRRHVSHTLRDLPAGTSRLTQSDFGFAVHEHVEAGSGCFSSYYSHYVAVLTERPSTGPVRFNGGDIKVLPERARALNFFRPDDRVEGVWRTPNTYEVLLFAPGYVETFVTEELGSRYGPTRALLRAEPSANIEWLWRRLVAGSGGESDVARMQTELIANTLLALLVAPIIFAEAMTTVPAHADIAKAIRHIHDNLGASLTIGVLAQITALSPFHFCRVFKRVTGSSVHRYVTEQRLMNARVLLETTRQPISQVALETGFASQSHLNSAFKERFGATPRAWRSRSRTTTAG